jgi:hypothetical protein
MGKNTKFVNELLKDLKRTSKFLKEDYIFNDGPDGGYGPEDEYGDMEGGEEGMRGHNPAVENDPTAPQNMRQHQQPQPDSAEEQAMHAQEVIKHEPIIGKIRETAIEGLKKYADNPTSKLYEFFKKVFLESDKVLTDTGSKNN